VEKMRDLSPSISRLAHKLSPWLGNLYDKNQVFWNDGIVGFLIGVPLTWIIYNPIAPSLHLSIIGINLTWLIQFMFYIVAAFFSFCIQHLLRKRWVFKGGEK